MKRMGRFAGADVLVTGAGSGIGRQIALDFAAEGARVLVTDADGASAARVAAEIAAEGGTAVSDRLDVTDQEQAGAVLAAHGCPRIVVNNAGVASDTPFPRLPRAEWDRDIEVVLTGTFLVCQTFLPAMAANGGGAVVNVGSINASGFFGNDAYSAAKAGLESLTRSLAVRYGRAGVRVNLVAPATIATPIWQERIDRDPTLLERLTKWYPLGRVGTPEDVAAAVMFLAGPEAGWITGTVLRLDGGLMAGDAALVDEILSRDYLM
ncbi:NAD(P)-dependent dehydrogenase (short-subunit alcohol dehydrogenase family) [Hamadaea flava]|uniref:SDR family NAD(P)-dependent oxidoreductase n=1 Tax=Hamadaea flava TaxID=1742688 RepID=A0ABV8LHH8_9ACTN|nr:SDR family oxidoreductase [Hamadaea flava]MCP2324230.1 NAD(P)-dependent dehydrogenase (short-subunit alcohol dehydrogenase family) [Hamadaea flava]